MTKTYRIQARCIRPFAAWIEIEADTPEAALSKARLEAAELTAAAEDSESWDWDEFAVLDDSGAALLHVLDYDARLREAASTLLEALDQIAQGYNDGGKLSREGMQWIAKQAIAEATGRAA